MTDNLLNALSTHGDQCICLACDLKRREAAREALSELISRLTKMIPYLRAHMTCEDCSAADAEIIRGLIDE